MGWFGGISEAGKRVFNYLIKGIQEGLSGTEIMRVLREHGLGYRLSDFYNDLRILKGETLKWDTMKYVPRDKMISERLYTPTLRGGERKFLTVFEATVYDPSTGERFTTYVSVGHDTPMRRIELEEEARELLETKPELYQMEYGYVVEKLIPIRGYVRV
ncbi:MAG: hypothetical protein QXH85_05690 [Candidatus Bathyarchaeia archaeon]